MLNDALNSSFSPAGQKSFNKRLKDLENKIDGYDESIVTGNIEADKGTIKELKSESIEADTLKINLDADIENLKFNTAQGNEATIGSVKSTSVESTNAKFDNAEATNLSSTDATIENIESDGTINANVVNAKELTVEKIIDKLNIHNLEIDNKKALNSLAEAVLQVGTGYQDASFSSGNRPKWGELKIATEEQVNGPFTIKGKVNSIDELPLSFDDSNVECEIAIPTHSYRMWAIRIFGGNLNWSEEEPHGNVATFIPTAYSLQKRFVEQMCDEVNEWLHEKGYDQYISDITEADCYPSTSGMDGNTNNGFFQRWDRFENNGTAFSIYPAAGGTYQWSVNGGAYTSEADWDDTRSPRATHVIKSLSERLDEYLQTLTNDEIIELFARINYELTACGKSNYVSGTNIDISTIDDPTNTWMTKPMTAQYWRGFTQVPGTVVEDQVNTAGDVYIVAGDNPGIAIWVQVDALDSDYVETTALIPRTAAFNVSSSDNYPSIGIAYTVGDEGTSSPLASAVNLENKDDKAYTTCKVYRGGVWTFIPYMILANYRTAADQNAIDNQIHENIMEIRTWQETQDHRITTNEHAIADNKAAQDIVNEQVNETFDEVGRDIQDLTEKVDSKISDAPSNGKVYGRKDHAWVDVATDGMYVPKVYNKVEKYFTNITLKKDPSYVSTSQLVEILIEGQPVSHYVGLWHLQPAEAGDLAYTTKNMYDFVKEHQDIINETAYQGVVDTFEAGRVLGTLDNITYQDLSWTDTLTEFDSTKPGDNIERPDGATLGTNRIVSDDNGVDVNSDIGFKANTPSPASDNRSVINRQYIDDNLSLSTSSASSGVAGAVLEFKHPQIDLVTDRAWSYQPRCQLNLEGLQNLDNGWYRRCKDYVYYKIDNTANQSASSFSFWMSVDRNGNVINMNNPREDKGNAVANQSDFEYWLTYSPELWADYPETANVAYWPHSNPTYAGYITMFDNGRFSKYVEDATGVSNGIYQVATSYYDYRTCGGKSLRGKPRMLVLNNSATDADSVKAGIIGLDSNNVEGLDKFKPVTLPLRVKHGFKGVGAGKKHWFAQQNTSNTFMVISDNGTVASYVLSDPVTQVALGTTVQNAQENYIELANGDVIFCVKDYSTDLMYHIYCHDNFEEEGIDPFTVYRSAIDFSSAAADGWPCCKGFPYVEFGDYVYFFPTLGADLGSTNGWLANNTMASQYSRFNKSTKTWSDATLPWNNSGYGGVVPVKTYDPIEDKDYLWLFQSQYESTAGSPCQAQVVVISENGALQYVDLGTGTTIHWFDNTARTGETQIGGYSRPLNISGDVAWSYAQTVRGNVPYVAVTQQGIGIMLSNAARDVCVFYGNCHFAIYSYDNATDGGPWSYFSGDVRRGPSFIGGKYGAMLYVNFNNALDLVENDTYYGVIYIKPTGDDYLGEPQYFWKPTSMDYIRMWREKYDGADWAKTDFSDYKKEGLVEVTPVAGGWEPTVGMANIRIEDIPASSTLYLKDGDYIISSVNIGGGN